MRGFLLAAAVATVLTLSAPRAAVAAPGDNPPPELGLGAGQLLMGTAIASLAIAVPVFLDGTPFELLGLAALVAGPAAVGGTVCTFGQKSKLYEGTCGSALIGAYLGALTSLPLAVLGGGDAGDGSGGTDYTSGTAIMFMVGYALGASIGATIGWHSGKEERSVWSRLSTPSPLSGAADQHWPELRWRPVPGARVATGVSVPLLVFAF